MSEINSNEKIVIGKELIDSLSKDLDYKKMASTVEIVKKRINALPTATSLSPDELENALNTIPNDATFIDWAVSHNLFKPSELANALKIAAQKEQSDQQMINTQKPGRAWKKGAPQPASQRQTVRSGTPYSKGGGAARVRASMTPEALMRADALEYENNPVVRAKRYKYVMGTLRNDSSLQAHNTTLSEGLASAGMPADFFSNDRPAAAQIIQRHRSEKNAAFGRTNVSRRGYYSAPRDYVGMLHQVRIERGLARPGDSPNYILKRGVTDRQLARRAGSVRSAQETRQIIDDSKREVDTYTKGLERFMPDGLKVNEVRWIPAGDIGNEELMQFTSPRNKKTYIVAVKRGANGIPQMQSDFMNADDMRSVVSSTTDPTTLEARAFTDKDIEQWQRYQTLNLSDSRVLMQPRLRQLATKFVFADEVDGILENAKTLSEIQKSLSNRIQARVFLPLNDKIGVIKYFLESNRFSSDNLDAFVRNPTNVQLELKHRGQIVTDTAF